MDGFSAAPVTSAAALLAYPTIYLLSLPQRPSPLRIAQSREAISLGHCAIQTVLSILCLRRHIATLYWQPEDGFSDAASIPIVTKRSGFANCIVAIETSYLLSDSLILLHAYKTKQAWKVRKGNASLDRHGKGLNLLHLGIHHGVLISLLLPLQWYIANGWDKGILIIVALHLMNASSILGTTRWFLINFRAGKKRSTTAVTALYLAAFGLCRVYLMYWILYIVGMQQGTSPWTALFRLRYQCKTGTLAFGLVNVAWLLVGIRNFSLRLVQKRKAE